MLDHAYFLIGASILMHVAWNLLARYVDKQANYLWWGLLAHLLILGPYAFWTLLQDSIWSATLVQAMLASASANALYFVALRRAYHYAPVSWCIHWHEAHPCLSQSGHCYGLRPISMSRRSLPSVLVCSGYGYWQRQHEMAMSGT